MPKSRKTIRACHNLLVPDGGRVTKNPNIDLSTSTPADPIEDMIVVLSKRMPKDEQAALALNDVGSELFEALV